MVNAKNPKNNNSKAGPWVDEDRVKTMQEPLPLIDEYDKRPAVRDLIRKHRPKLDEMKQKVQDLQPKLYDSTKHDDLWMLRYYLSQKSILKAAKAAAAFLEFRHERQLDLTDIRGDPPGPQCSHPHVAKFFDCLDDDDEGNNDGMILTMPDPLRGTIIFMRMCHIPQSKLQSEISLEEWPLWYLLEWQFQMLDCVTRRTGRLTKGVRILDFSEYRLSQNHRPFMTRCSEWGKQTQDQYPQSLSAVYMVNAPALIQGTFQFLKNLIPKRFVEKFAILSLKNSHNDQKVLSQYIARKHLPEKYGGTFSTWPYPRHCDTTRSVVDSTGKLQEIKKTNTDSTANSSIVLSEQDQAQQDYYMYSTMTHQNLSSYVLCGGEITCCSYYEP